MLILIQIRQKLPWRVQLKIKYIAFRETEAFTTSSDRILALNDYRRLVNQAAH